MRIDPDSEEFIRKSVKDIEERLKFYEQYEGYNASYTFNMDQKIKEIEKCYKYK